MLTVYKRLSVVTGFGLLLVLLIANALITRRQLGLQIENQAWAAHSREVLYELAQTESLLKDAETGQRGFLYTGDPKYLTPYNQAIGRVEPQIDSLARLTADNPDDQFRIPQLRDLAQKKAGELSQTISLFKSGKLDEARQMVLSDVGLSYMDQIRLLIVQMEGEESMLDVARTERYRRSVQKTIASIYLTSLLAAVGLVLLAYYILRQIELREKHAAEMREREEWFRITLTSIGDGVIATDPLGRVTFMNPVAEGLIGAKLADIRGRLIHEVFPIFNEYTHKPAENPVSKVMERGIVVGLANHTVLQHLDGTLTPIEDSAAPIRDDRHQLLGVVLVFRDVTHERKSQEVLRKTERLASAARLSATVAHEINNPLEAIFNLVYVAKTNPDAPPLVVQQLAHAEQELERVAHITRQTLGFYRDSSVAERVDMAALIDSVIGLYNHKFHAKNISIQRQFAECPPFLGVPGELKQAISNLISNAADAVAVDGTIALELRCTTEDGRRTIEVVVADDGPGIPAEYAEKIFEPFFTTKQDVGTGLGLWVTKGIVERHGGAIFVGSTEGNGSVGNAQNGGHATRGAAFTIILPINTDSKGELAVAG